ncbi:MAG: sigma factor [Bacillota bacterium]|nr:sigma factor [Bacillota bacterium]MDW7684476.1 sigma factor [Bacillota bacterium]
MPRIIELYQPFIFREACRACRRQLEWGRDEELSVALLAFNEALDSYSSSKGTLEQLASVVVRRRLIDYFRRNKGEDLLSPEALAAVRIEEDWEQREREEEVVRYSEKLKHFCLDFSMVAAASPRHRQTRNDLQNVVSALISRDDLMSQLLKNGRLPQSELCKITGLSPRVLERGRTYIIALALLLRGDEFPYLRESLGNITEGGGLS